MENERLGGGVLSFGEGASGWAANEVALDGVALYDEVE